MPIRRGNNLIDNPQIGGNEISKIYVGAGIVYCRDSNAFPIPTIAAESNGFDGNGWLSGDNVLLTCMANDPDVSDTTGFTYEWYNQSDTSGTPIFTSTETGTSGTYNPSMTTSATNGVTVSYYCKVTDPNGAVVTTADPEMVTWLPAYAASLTYNGGTISGSTSSTSSASFTISGTNGVSPTNASISNLNHGLGNAGSNASESSFRSNVGSNMGGDTTMGTCTGTASPANSEVSDGRTYTYAGTRTDTTTAVTRTDTYSYTSSGPTTGSTRTITFTLSGQVPTGFFNASTSTNFDTASTSQTGRTGSDGRTGSASTPCGGTVSSGVTSTCPVTVTPASTTPNVPCTVSDTGTGIFTIDVSTPAGVTAGDSLTFTATITRNDSTAGSTISYNWNITGPVDNANPSGPSVTVNTTGTDAGTVVATCTASFSTTVNGGPDSWSAEDSSGSVAVAASGCNGTITASAPTFDTTNIFGRTVSRCTYTMSSSAGTFVGQFACGMASGTQAFGSSTSVQVVHTSFFNLAAACWYPIAGGEICTGTGTRLQNTLSDGDTAADCATATTFTIT